MSEPGDCRKCRDWRGCPGKEWYHYGEIRWCPFQVIWILQFKETLLEGHWPEDPYGADNNTSSRAVKTEASFVKPELIIGELEARLDRTPNKGELLITQIEDGRTLGTLSDGAREVLMYIKGWRRKEMPFSKWQWQKDNRKSEDKMSSKSVI